MIAIRALHTIAELEAAVDIQIAVWGLNPRNAVPSALEHVLTLRGGLVLGAYDDERIVGLLLALPAYDHDELVLWSHMTGVLASYQGRGIGTALKRFQREWALAHGYRRIGWTVDPLQRGNANFNFHILGQDAALISSTYHVNFYGDMDDDINRGIPSDRIEAMWHLDQPCLHTPADPNAVPLLSIGNDLQPCHNRQDSAWNASTYRIALPPSVEAVRRVSPDGLLAWRLALREALEPALAHGYCITDFVPDTGVYILRRLEGKGRSDATPLQNPHK
jgi:predicted GNAT superfamily acetyltransferase